MAFRLSLGLAFILALVVLGMFYTGNFAATGPLVLIFFIVLALGFRLNSFTKGFSFGMIIFAMVALGMYYPHSFIEYQGFQLSVLIFPLIHAIMFGMGTSLSLGDFIGVARLP